MGSRQPFDPFHPVGSFTSPHFGEQNLYVVETKVERPQDLFPWGGDNNGWARDESRLMIWAGAIAQRLQGPERQRPTPSELAHRMVWQPGYSVAYPYPGRDTALAFTEVLPVTNKDKTISYVLRQAGVTWTPNNSWPTNGGEELPPQYFDAIAAVLFCNTQTLDSEAIIKIQGYPKDNRSKERFFGDKAGFERAPGSPPWPRRGAVLQSTCGVVVSTLSRHYPFLLSNAAPPRLQS